MNLNLLMYNFNFKNIQAFLMHQKWITFKIKTIKSLINLPIKKKREC